MAPRSLRIDALRGVAVFGILLINIWSFVHGIAVPRYGVFDAGAGALDQLAVFFVAAFAEQKFYPIFAFLFGAGFALQTGARQADGPALDETRRRYRRRLAWLLAAGLLHATLVWFGDILTLYALTGFWLAYKAGQPLARLMRSLRILVVVQILLLPVAAVGVYLMHAQPLEDAIEQRVDAERLRAIFTEGGWGDIALARLGEFGFVMAGAPVLLPLLALLFLLGVFAVRLGWLTRPQRHRAQWRKVLVTGLAIGVPFNLWWGYLALRYASDPFHPAPGMVLAETLSTLAAGCLAGAYVAGAMLARGALAAWLARWLAPVGRMALTNYLTQSLLCSVLLQGFGFGLGARLGHAQLLGLCAAIMLLQMALSRWWLARHAQGPFEALWRRHTDAYRGA